MEIEGIAEKSESEIEERGKVFCHEIAVRTRKKGECTVCLLDALRISLRCLQTDCFAEAVLSVTMIFRVTVGVVDDEKNGRSSQSCARRLHSRSFYANGD